MEGSRTMKKIITAALAAVTLASSFALGAIADDALDTITATLRRNSDVKVDGAALTMIDAEEKTLYPIEYDGVVYLPASLLGAAFGATLSVDAETGAISYTTRINAPTGSTMTQERINALRGVAVFWAPTGNKIHSDSNCRSFKNGVAYAGTYEQAITVRTDGWCGICGSFTENNPHAVDFHLEKCYTFEDFNAGLPVDPVTDKK